jgi:hypothetical protein
MRYDPAKSLLACEHCGAEQAMEAPEEWVAEELTSFEDEKHGRAWEGTRQIACESCGGSWVLDAAAAASACPFCGRAHVNALDADMVTPGAVIPFAVNLKQAETKFKEWVRKRRMSPRALRKEAFSGHWRGIYFPYWTFDADTATEYTANAGHYYSVPVTRTRMVNGKPEPYTAQVRHTRWSRVSGRVARFFDDILIRAVRLTEKAAAPENFDLSALKPYLPEFLSGFLARRYEIGLEEGYQQAGEVMKRQIRDDIVRDVRADEVQVLGVKTEVLSRSYKHILLPLWGNHYTYRGKEYDVWVNGQNGRVSGKAPLSPWKVTLAILLGAAACAALAYALFYFTEYFA